MMSGGRTVFERAIRRVNEPRQGRGRTLALVAGCQLAGGVVALGGSLAAARMLDMAVPIPVVVLAWGLAAAGIGHGLGLRRWWLPVQALFAPAAAAGLWLQVPVWVYPAAFILLLAVQWNAARSGVPLYLTNRRTGEVLAKLLPDKPGLAVADLGSGLGGTLFELARQRPEARFVGFESAPLPFAWARLRLAFSGLSGRLSFVFGNYRQEDLGAFDVVYCFLSPVPMPEVYAKARREMRPGSMLISNSFPVPDHPADEILAVDDNRRTQLHIWRF